jgi:hypothetical protein
MNRKILQAASLGVGVAAVAGPPQTIDMQLVDLRCRHAKWQVLNHNYLSSSETRVTAGTRKLKLHLFE